MGMVWDVKDDDLGVAFSRFSDLLDLCSGFLLFHVALLARGFLMSHVFSLACDSFSISAGGCCCYCAFFVFTYPSDSTLIFFSHLSPTVLISSNGFQSPHCE
jgi:hypothetical protein